MSLPLRYGLVGSRSQGVTGCGRRVGTALPRSVDTENSAYPDPISGEGISRMLGICKPFVAATRDEMPAHSRLGLSTRSLILFAVLVAHAALMLALLRNDPHVPAGIRREFLLIQLPGAATRVPLVRPAPPSEELRALAFSDIALPVLPVDRIGQPVPGLPTAIAAASLDSDAGNVAQGVAALDLPDLQQRCGDADPQSMAQLYSPLPIALLVRVEADGRPSEVQTTSRLFTADIGKAVRACVLSKARFAPALLDGKPTASWVRVEWPASDGS